ncbi:alpha/beta fold hydrolase [Thalassotalea sp. PS06]|uniref:alpha/beta fold hydrolase n=1 Tax=Thalassotalea sp. PS06 TaxID=2594005 RepID=UPI00163D4AD8|nr:alpha/beta hydrolase [Thalassotalea sp. PS06]
MTISNHHYLLADNWYKEGQYFNYADLQIFYRDSNQIRNDNKDLKTAKPVLVLLHGFPTCSWDYAAIWPILTQHFRVVTLDFLGFGMSDKPLMKYSIFQQADITQALLEHLNIKHFHLLSHDFGDTVAIELLVRLQKQGQVQSLVLTNGGIFAEFHQPLLIQKLLASGLGKFITPLINFRLFKRSMDKIMTKPMPESQAEQYWQLLNIHRGKRVFPKLIKYMKERKQNRARWEGGLAATSVPVGLIAGEDDPISGKLMIQGYRTIKPENTVIAMANTGHYPHTEAPEQFLKHLFLIYQTLGIIPIPLSLCTTQS